uniref:Uncharacterized protein n=1 Tax=Rhipicephalus zambeziensis TaxID=60191 RepID=A0A224YFA7_9ACAR
MITDSMADEGGEKIKPLKENAMRNHLEAVRAIHIYIYNIYIHTTAHRQRATSSTNEGAVMYIHILQRGGLYFQFSRLMRMQTTAVIPRNSFVLNAGSSQTSVQHVAPLKTPPTNSLPLYRPSRCYTCPMKQPMPQP